jgi:hypothetical protein
MAGNAASRLHGGSPRDRQDQVTAGSGEPEIKREEPMASDPHGDASQEQDRGEPQDHPRGGVCAVGASASGCSSLRRLRVRGPLVALALSSIFFAYALAPVAGVTYGILGAMEIGALYGVLRVALWGISLYSDNRKLCSFFTILGNLSIWTALGALFLVYPAFSGTVWRVYENRAICSYKLQKLYGAMRAYRETHGVSVPQCITDERGQPLHSWRVLLLPFLEETKMYNELRLNQPWDSPHNHDVLIRHARVAEHFRCPAADEHRDRNPAETTYLMFSNDGRRYQLAESGSSDVPILIGEVERSGIHWAEPRDHPTNSGDSGCNNASGMRIGCYHDFANVLLNDGEVRSLSSGQTLFPRPGPRHPSPDLKESPNHKQN